MPGPFSWDDMEVVTFIKTFRWYKGVADESVPRLKSRFGVGFYSGQEALCSKTKTN